MPMVVLFLVSILAMASPSVFAVQHIVGDSSGWTNFGDYTTWADSKTFNVGDTLCKFCNYITFLFYKKKSYLKVKQAKCKIYHVCQCVRRLESISVMLGSSLGITFSCSGDIVIYLVCWMQDLLVKRAVTSKKGKKNHC